MLKRMLVRVVGVSYFCEVLNYIYSYFRFFGHNLKVSQRLHIVIADFFTFFGTRNVLNTSY